MRYKTKNKDNHMTRAKKNGISAHLTPIGEERPKLRSYEEHYQDLFTLRQRPVPEVFIERLSGDLIKWAKEDEKALRLYDFFDNLGISPSDIKRWREKYPCLEEACQYAIRRMGARREQGALERKYDPGMVRSTQSHYCEIYRAVRKEEATIKFDTGNNNAQIKVELAVIPETNVVKRKEILFEEKDEGDSESGTF